MDRSLASLSDRFRPLAILLLAKLVEAGIPVMIIQTFRTDEEQAGNLANGTSWVKISKHQKKKNGKPAAEAIDICPYSQYQLHGPDKLQWDEKDPVWREIGKIGKSIGLRWGGDFKAPAKPDPGHFELPKTAG